MTYAASSRCRATTGSVPGSPSGTGKEAGVSSHTGRASSSMNAIRSAG